MGDAEDNVKGWNNRHSLVHVVKRISAQSETILNVCPLLLTVKLYAARLLGQHTDKSMDLCQLWGVRGILINLKQATDSVRIKIVSVWPRFHL
jgi:hypothetical protein